jgi:hypothetical protein
MNRPRILPGLAALLGAKATDDLGLNAVENKVGVRDWRATVLQLLAMDHERLFVLSNSLRERLTGVAGSRVLGKVLAWQVVGVIRRARARGFFWSWSIVITAQSVPDPCRISASVDDGYYLDRGILDPVKNREWKLAGRHHMEPVDHLVGYPQGLQVLDIP